MLLLQVEYICKLQTTFCLMKEKNVTLHTCKYLALDYVSAFVAWFTFFMFRKQVEVPPMDYKQVLAQGDAMLYVGLVVVPLFWLLLYYIVGAYNNIYHKARVQELGQTLVVSIIGSVLIFFALILNDNIQNYRNYYQLFCFLFSVHFGLTCVGRTIITSLTIRQLRRRQIGFPTIIIGNNEQALQMYCDLTSKPKSAGEQFVGFVTINGEGTQPLDSYLPFLGKLENLIQIIKQHKIEEVIIAVNSAERTEIQRILTQVKSTDVIIKAIPDMLDVISGKVKMSSIFGSPFVELSHDLMPAWEANIKRLADIVVSLIVLVSISPFMLVLAVCVKHSSIGPVFYLQERIGRYGKPFNIIKFRTMYTDAEKYGPALASKDDKRITPIGRVMRKMRFDELPQFINVLKGDMSLVGPRPERQFFISKIAEKAPHYYSVFKVRPGITSWGQVKYGYAETVDEMVDRLKYDIIYLENMSLYTDIKILIYTVKTVLEGRGQ